MALKILVADDELVVRDLVLATLRCGPSYEFLEAEDGRQALDLAAAEHPDLVLLDIVMPGLDGFEVCRQLRTMPGLKDTPIVMLTALGQDAHRESGFRAGADGFLTKPFSPAELIAKVAELLDETVVVR